LVKLTRPIIVSACLVGLPVRYDGEVRTHALLLDWLKDKWWLPVCPEQLGGLPTPRPPARIVGAAEAADGAAVLAGQARVVDSAGLDLTPAFIHGAEAVLAQARVTGARLAVLKAKSPSCGPDWATGSDGTLRPPGVTAALLKRAGLIVVGLG
jgi:uncharacterized protein YbbK (DUF523 family)